MEKPQWGDLVEQLQDPDPGVRRKACQRLAATGDPAVLPFLRNAYLQEDDPQVHEAARRGLAAFKAMQLGVSPGRQLPLNERVLTIALGGLAALFVISLLLNVVGMLGSGDDEKETNIPTGLTAWETLTTHLEERVNQAQEDTTNLRQEISHHNDTGEVACNVAYHKPQQVQISEEDRQTYRDLTIITDSLNLALFQLQQPQASWDQICQTKVGSMAVGVDALKKLDQVETRLQEVDKSLQKAIDEPAPTMGPSPTLPPTITSTPEPSLTAAPGTATVIPSVTNTPPPTATPTNTPTPTKTPMPTPNLDYTEITRGLSRRFEVMGDLQNSYNTGMTDYWRRAQEGEVLSNTFCRLPAWPEPFTLTEAQQVELNKEGVADPELEAALRLTNEGLTLAVEARALYEPSCQNLTLADTAAQGIALAESAREKLVEAQQLVETIRGRG